MCLERLDDCLNVAIPQVASFDRVVRGATVSLALSFFLALPSLRVCIFQLGFRLQ